MGLDEEISTEATAANASAANPELSSAQASDPRQRSTIAFPYNSMEDAGELAQRMHDNVGHGECSDAQLAAWLGMSAKSSTLRVRVSSARMFGLIEPGVNDDHRLTDLGKRFVDPNRSRDAKVVAFLTVPLYRAVFDHYEDGVLPPAAALERQIAIFGAAEKQKGRARSVLERSAEYAGFFDHGRNRLVKPGVQPTGEGPSNPSPDPAKERGGSGGNGGGFEHDPMIVGLFKRLPRAEDMWSIQDRQRWLQTAAQVFDLIYGDEDEGRIVVSVSKRDEAT